MLARLSRRGRPLYRTTSAPCAPVNPNSSYQAGTWIKPRRVIPKVERHPGELYSRVGFIVRNMSCPAERALAFCNKRGTGEQWLKEGKGAIKWMRLSCRTFAANAVRLKLHALAYKDGWEYREPSTSRMWASSKFRKLLPSTSVQGSSGESRLGRPNRQP